MIGHIHPKEIHMPFTLLFAVAALLILIVAIIVAFIKKGWKAALITGCITFVVLAITFVLTITIIVNAMDGNPV